MRSNHKIAVVIPALNEEAAIGAVLDDIPDWVDDVVVVDNGSADRTPEVARAHGARVLKENTRGYGAACLTGIASLDDDVDVLVFLDGDYSDYPDEMGRVVDPIVAGEVEVVIGSRPLGARQPGALTPQARFGNWLSCLLMRLFWGVCYTDLGPFRAISFPAYKRLGMRDMNYGWTVELQIKAATLGLRSTEVPVSYRVRIGESKVSGTVRGVIGAGTKILYTIFRAAVDARFAGESESPTRERLIVFTRYPEPGRAKTRLVPALGEVGAADLSRRMTERQLGVARRLTFIRSVELEVRYEGGGERLIREWLGPGSAYAPQGEGDLGKRMARAITRGFDRAMESVVLIGTDIPGVTPALLSKAFEALADHDLVLGPTTDGGYYLIGMNKDAAARAIPGIFNDVPWSTEGVLERTLAIAGELDLSTRQVDELADIDRPDDLAVWEDATGEAAAPGGVGKISVIVPALNEARAAPATLERALAGDDVEVIVVDGGSSDETAAKAESLGARVVKGSPPRSAQQNLGAKTASGGAYLFLHADTLLPKGWDRMVRETLAGPGVAGGAFELGIDSDAGSLRPIERLANYRSRSMGLPFGDQALFMRAEVFGRAGGFPEIELMEDYEMARRLGRRGRLRIVPSKVLTSPRRWETLGVLRNTLINQAIIVSYRLGVSPVRLARWYRGGGI